jgi:hypothetical protein
MDRLVGADVERAVLDLGPLRVEGHDLPGPLLSGGSRRGGVLVLVVAPQPQDRGTSSVARFASQAFQKPQLCCSLMTAAGSRTLSPAGTSVIKSCLP